MTKARKKTLALVGGLAALGAGLLVWLWPRGAIAGDASVWGGSDVDGLLEEIFAASGIPLWFAFACAELESNFNPRAYNPERGTGAGEGEGSYGLFQIFWRAHREALEAQHITQEDLFDPRVNAMYWRAYVLRLASQEGATPGDAPSWERVRLRLAGLQGGSSSADAQARLARYRPKATKWRERLA